MRRRGWEESGGGDLEFLKVQREGDVGVISFHNPPYNFMTAGMVRELDRVTRVWAGDPSIRAIVVTSAVEHVFVTHYEIRDILAMFRPLQLTPRFLRGLNTQGCLLLGRLLRTLDRLGLGEPVETALRKTPLFGVVDLECIHRVFCRLERMDKVVVAAISGEALGGATELALACDFRLMAEGDYRFGLPEITVAIIPGAGGTQRLTRLVGHGRAIELMLEGSMLRPGEALSLGLVHRVVAPEALMDEALALARRMAKRPPRSVAGIKQAVRHGGSLPLRQGLEVEKAAFFGTAYLRDPVRAFEYYLAALERGQADRDILEKLQRGETVRFTGR